jgi:hypothetical protein
MTKRANYTPNEMRSNVKNPNNATHTAANANRSAQLNPQHPNFGGKHEVRIESARLPGLDK